jgi:hypothetical protein
MKNADELAWFEGQVFEAAQKVVRSRGRNESTVLELLGVLRLDYPEFSEKAIRNCVVSKCGENKPETFERVSRGLYRLGTSSFTSS